MGHPGGAWQQTKTFSEFRSQSVDFSVCYFGKVVFVVHFVCCAVACLFFFFVGLLLWKGRLRNIFCISLVSMQRCVILFGIDAEMFDLVKFRCRSV